MKKVLVTGAAGFIGSNVVKELTREDVEIRALIRPGSQKIFCKYCKYLSIP